MKQKKIFERTLNWLSERIKNGTLDTTNAETIENAMNVFKSEFDKELYNKNYYHKFYEGMKKNYKSKLKSLLKKHYGVNKKGLKDFEKDAQEDLKNRIKNSFNLMKNKSDEVKARLASRFINYVSLDSMDVRGNKASEKSFLEFMKIAEEEGIIKNHASFILRDQIQKFNAGLDFALADKNDCIGVFWHTMEDERVVGTHGGLYPKGNKSHNNHYKRDGKFYIFKNSYYCKNGYVKGSIYDDLEDGGIEAVGCRCALDFVYSLLDVPKSNLTKKGFNYVNK